MTTSTKTALIIGATGAIGGAVTKALIAHGWRIKALNRNPKRASEGPAVPDIEWIKGMQCEPATLSQPLKVSN